MEASEYERKFDEEPPEPIDGAITMGTTPEPDFDSSPDVAVDGSVNRSDAEYRKSQDQQRANTGWIAKIRNWLN